MTAYDDSNQTTGTLPVAGQETQPAPPRPEPPAWLARARAELPEPGRYLAWQLDGAPVVVALAPGLTRIGRSLSAEIRFDDATVSRRHALVALDDGGARVMDDRSLNGIHVNGRRVETSPLSDGDEVLVGRHAIYLLDTTAVHAPGVPPAHALA
jgi:pSer/pThr/pTyr-binding forkhead associated (FHA) protein